MIKEHDMVAITIDLAHLGLYRGDVGTVVYIYGSSSTYEVEFINAVGDTVAVETLHADQIHLIDQRKAVLHVADLPTQNAA